MAFTGYTNTQTIDPGNFLGRGGYSKNGDDGPLSPTSPFALPEDAKRDPRVEWAQTTAATLRAERAQITKEIQRANDLYDGKQWQPGRAPWKNSSIINYCAWAADQWAAILADNKPKCSFEAFMRSDQEQADIANAEFASCYDRNNWQAQIEDAILMSRIEKKSYLRLTYDPLKVVDDATMGDQRLQAISATQVYANKEATSIHDASLVLFEYWDQVGDVLFRYPALEDKIRYDQQSNEERGSGSDQLVPPQVTSTSTNPQKHLPPYSAPTSPPADRGSGGVMVREIWTRPKGPSSQTTIKRMRWNAANLPVVERRYIKMADGTREPLQTVVTEGNIVYELPMSVAMMFEHASDMLGGVKVVSMHDAFDAVQEDVKAPMFPTGRRLVVVGDFVADDGCNPFGHGRIPLIEINAYRKKKTFYGPSDIDRIATLQEYLNKLYALLLDAAILTSNPIWLIPTETQIADEDFTNAPGAIIRGESMMMKLARREPGPQMPPYVQALLQFTIQQIREVSGLTESATGGKFKGQVASETVSMYQESAGVRFRQGIRNVEQAIVELGEQFLGNMQQFYASPRVQKIRDEVGAEVTVRFFGSEISANMRMKAKAGSMLPQSPSARLSMFMQLASSPMPIVDLPEVWKALAEVGYIDSAGALEKRMTSYMTTNKADLWKAPALMAMLMGGKQKQHKGGQSKLGGGQARKGKH